MEERILIATGQEMEGRGLKFTIDAVALRLGISKKTIYQYYASKDELVCCLIDAVIADMGDAEAEVVNNPSASLAERLKATLTVRYKRFPPGNNLIIADLQKYRPDQWQKIENYRAACCQRMQRMLEQGIVDGTIRPIHTEVAVKMLRGAVNEFLQDEFLRTNPLRLDEVLNHITDIFLLGVVNSK